MPAAYIVILVFVVVLSALTLWNDEDAEGLVLVIVIIGAVACGFTAAVRSDQASNRVRHATLNRRDAAFRRVTRLCDNRIIAFDVQDTNAVVFACVSTTGVNGPLRMISY